MRVQAQRTPILYLAPWVDFGGSDRGTIDWFRWIDRTRFAPSIITTQPSPNRRIAELAPFAEEIWALPDLMAGGAMPRFILDFIDSRRVDVLHIMNSRLAFDLLPDIHTLVPRPKVVVQLHVEEPDRSGYVRYVTTRFGNLVDAFSVTSDHLASAVVGWGVPRGKVHMIPTCVDAAEEFDPGRVAPAPGFPSDRFNVLYPGRFVPQKDPLLMVEVIERLRERVPSVLLHAPGDGPLEEDVRVEMRRRGIGEHIRFAPPTTDLAPWYAASDALLMTSVFEGVPYVVYEAMAMGVPVVAPALPGNRELLGDDYPGLVEPRVDVDAYVARLATLAEDAETRAREGRALRDRALTEFPLSRMGSAHDDLYDRLLAGRSPRPPFPLVDTTPPEPIKLAVRSTSDTPRVSVVIPCYNHGRWLLECLESISAQDYPDVEVIVVDDGSDDVETHEVLDKLEADGVVRVLRQSVNAGPSAARNRAIDVATGRYVLPVDADNALLPGAISALVADLQAAGPQVGFVYQNLRYFGNRDDYFEAPPYNLYHLLHFNYCDTSALIDRAIFDAGMRYPEEIMHGHEDWDFALSLGEREIVGVAAAQPTIRFRKHGFTRSDTVELGRADFADLVKDRHPALFGDAGSRAAAVGPTARIKSQWSPTLSIIVLGALDDEEGDELRRVARAQTATDAEVLVFGTERPDDHAIAPVIRSLPLEVLDTGGLGITEALRRARGQVVCVTEAGASLFAARNAIEGLLRLVPTHVGDHALVLVSDPERPQAPFAAVAGQNDSSARPHTCAWIARADPAFASLSLDPAHPVDDLVVALAVSGHSIDRCHLTATYRAVPFGPAGRSQRIVASASETSFDVHAPDATWRPPPLLATGSAPRRWARFHAWLPPQTSVLTRHVSLVDGSPLVAGSPWLHGYAVDRYLGAINLHGAPGTERLARAPGPAYRLEPVDEDGRAATVTLGYLEQVAFVGLEPVFVGCDDSGREVMAAGEDDPLLPALRDVRCLGFIERVPINPQSRPVCTTPGGLRSLFRTLNAGLRCHRYGTKEPMPGELTWELGCLLAEPRPGTVPIAVRDAGIEVVGLPTLARPRPATAARWALQPARWGRAASPLEKGRAILRRSAIAAKQASGRGTRTAANETEVGYLFADPGPGRIALLAAVHPVTADVLLTTDELEPAQLGYGPPSLVGYLVDRTFWPNLRRRPSVISWPTPYGEVTRFHIGGPGLGR